MLTKEEKEAALSAKHFTVGWGEVVDGEERFCPAAAVAIARGARLEVPQFLGLTNRRFFIPVWNDERFNSACRDVAEWLGFENWTAYAKALQVERADILKRANA